MKKVIVALCALCAAVVLLSFLRTDRDRIAGYVEAHEEMLIACLKSGDYAPAERSILIREVNVEEDHVDFRCGASGFASQTSYRGFFYSEQDDMYAVWCAPPEGGQLIREGNGFFWEETEGDNRYYVEKICGHFYYYEASF